MEIVKEIESEEKDMNTILGKSLETLEGKTERSPTNIEIKKTGHRREKKIETRKEFI